MAKHHQSKKRESKQDPKTAQNTSKLSVPVDMVGCIIGKGGSLINEIREKSGAKIHIAQKEHNRDERDVLITGDLKDIQTALDLLQFHIEQEKLAKQSAAE